MTDNPRIIFAENSCDGAVVFRASEMCPYFNPEPEITEISKGEVELLDSKRTPAILVCPLHISIGNETHFESDQLKIKPSSLKLRGSMSHPERKSTFLKSGDSFGELKRDAGSLKLGSSSDQLAREHTTTLYGLTDTKHVSKDLENKTLHSELTYKPDLSEDQGYSSMGHVTGEQFYDQIRDHVKEQVSLALGCIADEEATSIVFFVKLTPKGMRKDELKDQICKALKEIFPDTYGNRPGDPNVCFLNEELPSVLDKMLENVLMKQMKLLQTSVERIQKDFVAQATPRFPNSESHLNYILDTLSKLIVPDEEVLQKIDERVKSDENNKNRGACFTYSDYFWNQLLEKVTKDAFAYIDREFSPMDKTIVSNAIANSRMHKPLKGNPNWIFLLTLLFSLFVLFILVKTDRFGFLEAIGLEVVLIHLLVEIETSSLNKSYVVSSVYRYLHSYMETIKNNICTEHTRSMNILLRRKEFLYKAQIQIRRIIRDLNSKTQHMDDGSRVNIHTEEYLLSSPVVIGFGLMDEKLYVHVLDEKAVETVKQQLTDTYKLNGNKFAICSIKSSKDSIPQFDCTSFSPISIGKPIDAKLGFFFKNCNKDVFFVIHSSIIPRCHSVTIRLSNNKIATGKLKVRTDDKSFNNTNFYRLTVFQIEEGTSTNITASELHNCEGKEQHFDCNTIGLIVETPNVKNEKTKSQFLIISNKYTYKGLDAKNSKRMVVSLAVPVGLEQTPAFMKPGLITYNRRPIGLEMGILKSVQFQCDDEVDLGREELLAVIPYNMLLIFLHNFCCEEEEIRGHTII